MRVVAILLAVCLVHTLAGCGAPPLPQSGFLSDYSKLEPIDANHSAYIGPRYAEYEQFIIDPIIMKPIKDPPVLTEAQRAEVANYFRDTVIRICEESGHTVVDRSGVGVARIRFAVTDIRKSKWYLGLHPIGKATGAGAGGAALELEVIDSVTGEQLAASIRSGQGNQFEFDTFNAIDDAKDVIDRWARDAEVALREFRDGTAEGD